MSFVSLMRVSVRVVLVGTVLLLANHLGHPWVVSAEPLPIPLYEPPSGLCEGGGAVVEPEAVTPCVLASLPAAFSSVKQRDGLDSSTTLIPSSAPLAHEASPPVVSLPGEPAPTVPASIPSY